MSVYFHGSKYHGLKSIKPGNSIGSLEESDNNEFGTNAVFTSYFEVALRYAENDYSRLYVIETDEEPIKFVDGAGDMCFIFFEEMVCKPFLQYVEEIVDELVENGEFEILRMDGEVTDYTEILMEGEVYYEESLVEFLLENFYGYFSVSA